LNYVIIVNDGVQPYPFATISIIFIPGIVFPMALALGLRDFPELVGGIAKNAENDPAGPVRAIPVPFVRQRRHLFSKMNEFSQILVKLFHE
jgi:hypothetical protein